MKNNILITRLRRWILSATIMACASFLFVPFASAAVISIDFSGSNTNAMTSSEAAGVVSKANWNTASGPISAAALKLVNETGTATNTNVSWTSDNVWNTPTTDVAGNNRMMRGYLDNGNSNPSTVTVSGLASGTYSIYVYVDGDNATASRTALYQISGTGMPIVSTSLTDSPNTNFGGTFIPAANGSGNYVLFGNVKLVAGFTLTASPGANSDGYARAPVNGIQIVPVTVPNPDFTIAATPASQAVTAGNLTTYNVSVGAVNGFAGTVTLSTTGLPAGATASFNPSAITGSGSSTLTVTTVGSTVVGTATLAFTGISGALTHSAAATLAVGAPPVPVALGIKFVGTGTPMSAAETAGMAAKANWNNASGASSTSALSLISETGLATGASVTWTSDNTWATSISDVAGNNRMMRGYLDNVNGNASTVNVSGIRPGTYNVYVYTDGDNSGSSRTGTYQISGSGITTASMSSTDAPNTDFTGAFAQANNSNGNYVVFTGVTIGSAFMLTATPGATTEGPRAPLNGIQIIPVVPDFSLSMTPGSQTVVAGGTATLTVAIGALNGFHGLVNLNASGLPAGTTVSFSPASVTGSGSVIATVTTSGTTPAGSSTVTISATSGSLSHAATMLLTVRVNQPPAVSAGGAQTITLPAPAQLSGTATDDGLPNGTLAYSWKTVSGPGTVTFGNAQSLTTTATFSVAGTYVFALTASDGVLASSAQCTVTAVSVTISLTPASTTLVAAQAQQFTPTVGGSANNAVAWTLTPSLGTISIGGMYTAPPTLATTQTVTVSATSMADPTKSASAVLVVQPAPLAGYYVSGTGKDSWSGLLPSPNAANTDGPFLTLARAQAAMRTSLTKTTYIRAGTYFPPATSGSGCNSSGKAAINLVASDSGETWSYYPPDGVNSAILDGGAPFVTQSGPTQDVAGAPAFNGLLTCAFGSFNGATHVTINGLAFQYWLFGPLYINGNGTPPFFTFTNNIVHDTRIVPKGGTIQLDCADGSVVSNNYIYNVPYHGVGVGPCAPSGPFGEGPASNITVSGNVIENSCTWTANQGYASGGDCGGIYIQLENSAASNIQFTNNYIWDINKASNGAGSFGGVGCCALGIYLDGAFNVTMSGNVIGGNKSGCMSTHGGGNHFVNNVCDIGAPDQIIAFDFFQDAAGACCAAAGNTFQQNIIVTNQSSGGGGYSQGYCGPVGGGCGSTFPMAISNNAYYNYGGASVKSAGGANQTVQPGDLHPAYLNPSLSCWGVGMAAGSPAFNSPVGFPGIKGNWGPPGFVIPQTGTAPSWPHGC